VATAAEEPEAEVQELAAEVVAAAQVETAAQH